MTDLTYEYLGQRFRPREGAEQQLLLFVAPASDIRSWAGVPRKAFDYQHGFQRTLNPGRVSDVVEYFREDPKNISPTAIVVGFTGAVIVEATGGKAQGGVEPIAVRITLPDLTELPLPDLTARALAELRTRIPEPVIVEIEANDVAAAAEANKLVDEEVVDETFGIESETVVDVGAVEPGAQDRSYLADFYAQLLAYSRNLLAWPEEGPLREILYSILRPAIIVDGQHRVFGGAAAEEDMHFAVCALPQSSWSETGVAGAIDALDDAGRDAAFASVAALLGLSSEDIARAALRLLIERARPLALPTALWSRPITASNDPASLVRAHFKRKGIADTPDRMRRALRLYAQFAEERAKVSVTEATLKGCEFRCQHCGLAFCNEDLAARGIVSPFGNRGAPKHDPLKPHWNDAERFRSPTTDHSWPVSLYGDNRPQNLKTLCLGCNHGKENYLALAQLRSSVGLPARAQFLGSGPVAWEAFYAQLRRHPACVVSGKTAVEAELTLRLKDPHAPAVFDNLETVESPGL